MDLGSDDIIAAKAPGAENVLRVKAAHENFSEQTNMTVICEDGTFYSFDVIYSKEPTKLNIILSEDIHSKYGEVSPRQVDAITEAIYRENKNAIKYLGSKTFSIQMLVRSIYVYEGIFFIHIYIKNTSNIPLDIDILRFKISDKKLVKRTAMQEIYLEPLASYSEVNEFSRIHPFAWYMFFQNLRWRMRNNLQSSCMKKMVLGIKLFVLKIKTLNALKQSKN